MPASARTFALRDVASLWVGLVVCVPAWTLVAQVDHKAVNEQALALLKKLALLLVGGESRRESRVEMRSVSELRWASPCRCEHAMG